jgi:hypothetical protein
MKPDEEKETKLDEAVKRCKQLDDGFEVLAKGGAVVVRSPMLSRCWSRLVREGESLEQAKLELVLLALSQLQGASS